MCESLSCVFYKMQHFTFSALNSFSVLWEILIQRVLMGTVFVHVSILVAFVDVLAEGSIMEDLKLYY